MNHYENKAEQENCCCHPRWHKLKVELDWSEAQLWANWLNEQTKTDRQFKIYFPLIVCTVQCGQHLLLICENWGGGSYILCAMTEKRGQDAKRYFRFWPFSGKSISKKLFFFVLKGWKIVNLLFSKIILEITNIMKTLFVCVFATLSNFHKLPGLCSYPEVLAVTKTI